MKPNGISDHDLNLYPPRAKTDPFRLSRVEKTLRNPFYLDSVIGEIRARTSRDTLHLAFPLNPDSLWELLDIKRGDGIGWSVVVSSPSLIPSPSPHAQAISRIDSLVEKMQSIQQGLREEVSGLTKDEVEFLYHETSTLFLQDEADTNRTAIESEIDRINADAKLAKVMNLASKISMAGLARASHAAWELETWILNSIKQNGMTKTIQALQSASKKMPDENFALHLGNKGDENHIVKNGIWMDTAGNDTYVMTGANKAGAFLMILDLKGDDTYLSKDSLDVGAGNMGIEMIADLQGNDHYIGKNFAFASTLFGYSSLFDLAGHDSYEGRCSALGFGFFGLGVLEDVTGNDVYSASLMSMGAGSTKGAGMLLDRNGNDQYFTKPTFKDDLRYNDHNLSMSEGFASGFAPDYAGGIGLLRDEAGNDFYAADIFGQGSAYWYALGILLDEGGDDRYDAYQYAQGAGVHIAVGALIDWAGNDHYVSKGVSQGCGHDLGFGLLYDKLGDDFYLATDMSQGAGSANGLGILHDALGNDIYESVNPAMTLGHGDMRRDRGSWGFFLDGGGQDRYPRRPNESKPSPQKNGSSWQVYNGKTKGNGFGKDE